MCENIDDNVGRLIAALENTDCGGRYDRGLLFRQRSQWRSIQWRHAGRKGSTFEGGLRSPCLIRYPAAIKAGTKVTQVAAAIDLLPTLADLAGITLDAPKPLDGVSVAPLLRRENVDWSTRVIFSAWNGRVSARSERFRMQADGGLFDIEHDPRGDA